MGVIIKNMEIPENCFNCEFCHTGMSNPTTIYSDCTITGATIAEADYEDSEEVWMKLHDGRQERCPLVEVPDGHWIQEPGKIPKCSVCGKYSDDADTGDAKFCPFCGARMDGE